MITNVTPYCSVSYLHCIISQNPVLIIKAYYITFQNEEGALFTIRGFEKVPRTITEALPRACEFPNRAWGVGLRVSNPKPALNLNPEPLSPGPKRPKPYPDPRALK